MASCRHDVVNVVEPAILEKECVAAEARPVREDDARRVGVLDLDVGDDLVRPAVRLRRLGCQQLGRAGVVEWKSLVRLGFLEPDRPLQNRKRTPTTIGNVSRPLSLLIPSRPVPTS
jgi:hypothetical protein